VLGATILKERLGLLGKFGCALCLLGSVLLVLHAPPDKDIQTIDEVLDLAVQPRMTDLPLTHTINCFTNHIP
jgi:magnesium transporter